jgi:hypothetical protein
MQMVDPVRLAALVMSGRNLVSSARRAIGINPAVCGRVLAAGANRRDQQTGTGATQPSAGTLADVWHEPDEM